MQVGEPVSAPSVDAPEKKPEEKKDDPKCRLHALVVECSHDNGGGTKRKGVKTKYCERMLEVVAPQPGDKVTLKAEVKPSCGNHPKWIVEGKPKSGSTTTYNTTGWSTEDWNLLQVKGVDYVIYLETCARKYPILIRCYPMTTISLEWVCYEGGEYAPRKRAERRRADKALRKKENRKNKSKKVSLARHLDNLRNTFDNFNKKLEDPIQIEYLKGAISFEGAWEEDPGSHATYYNWEIAGGFSPLLQISGTKRIRPWFLAVIPKTIRDYMLDVNLFITLEGSVSLQLTGGQFAPGSSGCDLTIKLSGEIKGSLGAELSVGPKNRKGWEVLKVTVKATTGFGFEARRVLLKPRFLLTLSWLGITASIEVELLGGMLKLENQVTIWEEASYDMEFPIDSGNEPAPEPPPRQAVIRAAR